jgi:hypothetical protein
MATGGGEASATVSEEHPQETTNEIMESHINEDGDQ